MEIPLHSEFKVRDKVEIIGNTIWFIKKGKIAPFYGTIREIDGTDIYIKPKYQRCTCHWYVTEIKKIEYVKESKI